MPLRFSRRAAFAAAGATALIPAIAAVQDAATPIASPGDLATPAASPVPATGIAGWPRYGRDLPGSRFNPQGVIATSNATALTQIWTVDVQGPVSATPIIAEGVAYVGSYDGNLYAIEIASGSVLWTYQTGAEVMEPNLQIPLGITGSAHVSDGVVFVGDATATVHAIDAATGEAIWTQMVDDQEDVVRLEPEWRPKAGRRSRWRHLRGRRGRGRGLDAVGIQKRGGLRGRAIAELGDGPDDLRRAGHDLAGEAAEELAPGRVDLGLVRRRRRRRLLGHR